MGTVKGDRFGAGYAAGDTAGQATGYAAGYDVGYDAGVAAAPAVPVLTPSSTYQQTLAQVTVDSDIAVASWTVTDRSGGTVTPDSSSSTQVKYTPTVPGGVFTVKAKTAGGVELARVSTHADIGSIELLANFDFPALGTASPQSWTGDTDSVPTNHDIDGITFIATKSTTTTTWGMDSAGVGAALTAGTVSAVLELAASELGIDQATDHILVQVTYAVTTLGATATFFAVEWGDSSTERQKLSAVYRAGTTDYESRYGQNNSGLSQVVNDIDSVASLPTNGRVEMEVFERTALFREDKNAGTTLPAIRTLGNLHEGSGNVQTAAAAPLDPYSAPKIRLVWAPVAGGGIDITVKNLRVYRLGQRVV
jgi:hypothetical protein